MQKSCELARRWPGIFFILLASASICSISFATDLSQIESETTAELLLYYDWDELLVEATNRRPTKLKQVAENISIVTAEEIKAMNAHSVQEILRTVTGMSFNFFGNHFGGFSTFAIHDSNYQHVLLLLDGVRLNDVDSDYNGITGIPVQIIERIEVIKGPASSAWGSSLGGVVNIVTKSVGDGRPSGTLYGSYGQGESQDLRAEAAGGMNRFGYYLYAGHMDSEGIGDDRFYTNNNGYAKFTSQLSEKVTLTLTGAYWQPHLKGFDFPASDENYLIEQEARLLTSALKTEFTEDLTFTLNFHYYNLDWRNTYETLGTGEFLQDDVYEDVLYGGNAGLTWQTDNHTVLAGVEYDWAEVDRSFHYGSSLAPPAELVERPNHRKDWAIYANDTIIWDKLTITPGLRYDHLSIDVVRTEDLFSPSLGMTYSVSEDTLLRATASNGFIRQPLAYTTAHLTGTPGNPELEPEDVWSYQAGIETDRFLNMYLKANAFYHRQDKAWYYNSTTGIHDNGGLSERKGVEVNSSFSPYADFTVDLGFTYIRTNPYSADDSEQPYDHLIVNTAFRYSTPRFGNLILFGQYRDLGDRYAPYGNFDNMLWELHYNKDIFNTERTTTNIFCSVRNIFSGRNTWDTLMENPDRWVEAGLRINF